MNSKLTMMVFFLILSFNSFTENKNSGTNLITGTGTHIQTKHTLSAAGGEMSGINYRVTSSIAQIDAGHITTGGDYQFIGGILAAPRSTEIFKNGFEQ